MDLSVIPAVVQAELEYVRSKALEIYTLEGVELWIEAPNDLLEHKSPRQMVEAGRTGEVLDLINAIAEGVFL